MLDASNFFNDFRFVGIMPDIFRHEGGYVNDPVDPGGATNYGISLRWLRTVGDLDNDGFDDGDLNRDGLVDKKDIVMIKPEDAARYYYDHWWSKFSYSKMPYPVGEKVFDMAINMGGRRAHILLQTALQTLGVKLTADGIIGPVTLKSITAVDSRTLAKELCNQQLGFYNRLIARKPAMGKYRTGWTRRSRFLPAYK